MRWATLILTMLISSVFAIESAQAGPPGCGSSHGETQVHGSGSVFTVNGQQAQSPADCPHPASTGIGPYLDVLEEACEAGGQAICAEGTPDCDGDGGRWHVTEWVFPDGHTEPGPQVCVGGEQAPAKQLTAERVLQAFREVPLPTPSLGTSPPDGMTLVNVPTIFYTRAEPFGRDVRVLGRRVHLEIAPVSYEWRVGQGGDFETTSPGSPYQRGVTPQSDPDAYVTWTYDSASSEAASVRVVWGATWSLGGKTMGRVPGTVEMLSSTATVRVREAQPVLTATLRD